MTSPSKQQLVRQAIKECLCIGHVRELNLIGNVLTRDEASHILRVCGAFWMYEGQPRAEAPHALLKSGRHSDGFVDCGEVFLYPHIRQMFSRSLFVCIQESIKVGTSIDAVASSAYSAIGIGSDIAGWLKAAHLVAEKDENGSPTKIRHKIPTDWRVLIVNELTTTADGSTMQTKEAVKRAGICPPHINFVPEVFTLINRLQDRSYSETPKLVDGSPVLAPFCFDIRNFDSRDCPYCMAGSVAIKPKLEDNWKKLRAGSMDA